MCGVSNLSTAVRATFPQRKWNQVTPLHEILQSSPSNPKCLSGPARPYTICVLSLGVPLCPHLLCSRSHTQHSSSKAHSQTFKASSCHEALSYYSLCLEILPPDIHIAPILTFSDLCSNVTLSETISFIILCTSPYSLSSYYLITLCFLLLELKVLESREFTCFVYLYPQIPEQHLSTQQMLNQCCWMKEKKILKDIRKLFVIKKN